VTVGAIFQGLSVKGL
jgi:hypothetical protein